MPEMKSLFAQMHPGSVPQLPTPSPERNCRELRG